MPIVLGEESHHIFSQENKPLSQELVDTYIVPTGKDSPDEFTEYVPCFAIEGTEKFAAIVWWKASLLRYEYVLSTFTLKGDLINQRVIAFTEVGEGSIRRSVATINEDWEIYMAEGISSKETDQFEPGSTVTTSCEILVNGIIED
jgi:hypothetical protein